MAAGAVLGLPERARVHWRDRVDDGVLRRQEALALKAG